jgi:transposase
MHQRIAFVAACLRDEAPVGALCEAFGISRKTGYKWLARYRANGPEGLSERPRAPHRHGRRMAPEAILALRRDRPHWGPRKLRAILQHKQPEVTWPAASTMGDLLRGHGLCEARRRRRSLPGPPRAPFAAIEAPNDLWCIDFRLRGTSPHPLPSTHCDDILWVDGRGCGLVLDRRKAKKSWFRTADGARCDPLTITDAHSRYVLVCQIVAPRHGPVEAAVGDAFARYGLPKAIRSDNGPPFAARGPGGLTRLSLEGRHRARANRPRPAAAERPPRAFPPHLEAGNLRATGGHPGRAAGSLRRLLPGLQSPAPARGAGSAPTGQPVVAVAAPTTDAPRGALVRRPSRGAQSPPVG